MYYYYIDNNNNNKTLLQHKEYENPKRIRAGLKHHKNLKIDTPYLYDIFWVFYKKFNKSDAKNIMRILITRVCTNFFKN